MGEFWTVLIQNIMLVGFWDIVDILVVTFGIYAGIRLVKGTTAAQALKGIVAIVVFAQFADWVGLKTISFLLNNTLQLGFLAVIIMFQPELRRALDKIGNTAGSGQFFTATDDLEELAENVSQASKYMADRKIGALIILERNTKLGDVMKSGTMLDATVSSQLLINIFMSNTPLHDGATIIGENRIKAAACFLPLTQNNNFSKELGTRHRAGIGVSEIADCISIIVSEETGKISIASDGELRRSISVAELKKIIIKELGSDEDDKTSVKNIPFVNKIVSWVVKKK